MVSWATDLQDYSRDILSDIEIRVTLATQIFHHHVLCKQLADFIHLHPAQVMIILMAASDVKSYVDPAEEEHKNMYAHGLFYVKNRRPVMEGVVSED